LGCKSDSPAICRGSWEASSRVRRILVIGMFLGLGACAHHQIAQAVVPGPAPVAPRPAEGLWAALDPGCAKPTAANIHTWPHCASPFWIGRGKATVLVAGGADKKSVRDVSYAADYRFDPGEPLIAQVGTPKDGYVWLALTDLDRDSQGRLIGAVGAAVPCAAPVGDDAAVRTRLNSCTGVAVDAMRKAAVATLQDRAALTTVAWIAPGAP
jgi:hypothetical protein